MKQFQIIAIFSKDKLPILTIFPIIIHTGRKLYVYFLSENSAVFLVHIYFITQKFMVTYILFIVSARINVTYLLNAFMFMILIWSVINTLDAAACKVPP